MSFIKFCKQKMFEERVGLGTTVRLLHCDLGVMGLKRGNSLTLPIPLGGRSLVHWAAPFL